MSAIVIERAGFRAQGGEDIIGCDLKVRSLRSAMSNQNGNYVGRPEGTSKRFKNEARPFTDHLPGTKALSKGFVLSASKCFKFHNCAIFTFSFVSCAVHFLPHQF